MKFTAIRKWNDEPAMGGAVFVCSPSQFRRQEGGLEPLHKIIECRIPKKPIFDYDNKKVGRQLVSRHFRFSECKQ